MKLVDFQYIQNGVRKLAAVKQTFEHIQESYKEAIASLTDGIIAQGAGVTVLYGCVNSGTAPTYDITAGAVYYNGEIYEVPAFSGTAGGADVPVLSLNTTYRTGDPALYRKANGTPEHINTHSIRKLLWSFAPSGFGIADLSAIVTIKSRLSSLLAGVYQPAGSYAPLDSPALMGSPTAPTATTPTNNTQLATTAFVHAVVAALVDSSPATLDTLNELAAALGDDPNFATTIMNTLADKASMADVEARVLKAGDVMTGVLEVPGIKTRSTGQVLLWDRFEIGEWDMDTNDEKLVSHNISADKVEFIKGVIFRDDLGQRYDLNFIDMVTNVGTIGAGVQDYTSALVRLRRVTGGPFDNSSFNANATAPESLGAGANRGYITIFYHP